jgi:hypothetical protein
MPWIIGENGTIVNVVGGDQTQRPEAGPGQQVLWSPVGVGVGGTYDSRDVTLADNVTDATLRVLMRHENMIRQLVRSVRTNSAINTAATTNGLPTTANAADVTFDQAKAAFKTLL